MPNRSYAELPSFYVYAEARQLDARRATPYPLEVYDITYMHFHSALELGVCMGKQLHDKRAAAADQAAKMEAARAVRNQRAE